MLKTKLQVQLTLTCHYPSLISVKFMLIPHEEMQMKRGRLVRGFVRQALPRDLCKSGCKRLTHLCKNTKNLHCFCMFKPCNNTFPKHTITFYILFSRQPLVSISFSTENELAVLKLAWDTVGKPSQWTSSSFYSGSHAVQPETNQGSHDI